MMATKPVVVREVWEENLIQEFNLIQRAILNYPYASFDTEFPGTVFTAGVPKHQLSRLSPMEHYLLMKRNVDALKLIQLGLTLSDAQGNLPDLGTDSCFIWQFNFQEFDVDRDLQNPESIDLLKRQGMDFVKNRDKGVNSIHFAHLFTVSFKYFFCQGRAYNQRRVTWVTFHSLYDFGFLVKVLIQRLLPYELPMFMRLLTMYFGIEIYDIKEIIKYCGLYGGLDKVAETLHVDRPAGKSHQAGSDSLVTMQAFMEIKKRYFARERLNPAIMNWFNYKLHGLAVC